MKVLLVEDDPMIGENIQIALESKANLVARASSARLRDVLNIGRLLENKPAVETLGKSLRHGRHR